MIIIILIKNRKKQLFTLCEFSGSSFEHNWIPLTKGCFVPNLVEIGPAVLEKKIFKFRQYIFAISPWKRAGPFIWTNLSTHQTKTTTTTKIRTMDNEKFLSWAFGSSVLKYTLWSIVGNPRLVAFLLPAKGSATDGGFLTIVVEYLWR